MTTATGGQVEKGNNILHVAEVQQHLEMLRLDHARRTGAAPPPLRPQRTQHPRKPNKSMTTIRLSRDVLVAFKATGKGWQTRMDTALQKLVAEGKI